MVKNRHLRLALAFENFFNSPQLLGTRRRRWRSSSFTLPYGHAIPKILFPFHCKLSKIMALKRPQKQYSTLSENSHTKMQNDFQRAQISVW
jgi:hypothetical protein